MMTGNLVGYALGVDGTRMMWEDILANPYDFGFVIFLTYFGVHLMFFIEESKAKNTVDKRDTKRVK